MKDNNLFYTDMQHFSLELIRCMKLFYLKVEVALTIYLTFSQRISIRISIRLFVYCLLFVSSFLC